MILNRTELKLFSIHSSNIYRLRKSFTQILSKWELIDAKIPLHEIKTKIVKVSDAMPALRKQLREGLPVLPDKTDDDSYFLEVRLSLLRNFFKLSTCLNYLDFKG